MSAATKGRSARQPGGVREGATEPAWITRAVIEVVHDAQLREHGGSSGIRDEGRLDSALDRPRNKWGYGEQDLSVLAAAYAFGIAKNPAFVDGNKRSAFTAAALFLALNGYELDAPEPEVVVVMKQLASGRISEAEFSSWARAHMERA